MSKFRRPTKEEQVQAWQRLAWEIDFARKISMDEKKVIACLDRMSNWVGWHSDSNGERPQAEVEANVIHAFWKFIHGNEDAGLKDKPKPPGVL